MVVITGLGRCGTTLMMLVYRELGYGVGRTLGYSERVRAGMELAPAYAISRDMYDYYLKHGKEVDLYEKHDGKYWRATYGKTSLRDRILFLDEDTPQNRKEGIIEVIKDPRITWHPKIIRAWWEVRKDLKLVILHRKPEEIIASRSKVGVDNWGSDAHFQDPKRAQRLHQFYEDWEAFANEVKELGIPHVLWEYPDFVDRPKGQLFMHLQSIDAMKPEIELEEFEVAWDTVFDRDLVHNFGGGG